MRIKSFLLFLVIFIAGISKIYSQPCTTLGQTPSTAFPVCGTSVFTQNNVPICGGAIIPTTCTGAAYQDVNPFYYRFTCFTAGTLGFILDPINNADDYDWVLFNITARNPNDIFSDISLNIGENWSATPGNTGASSAGFALSNCAGNTPNFSRMPSIVAGNEYLLMVSNFSASQQGYTLTFTGGTAGITDPVVPQILSVTPSCDGSQVIVRFNKKLKCSSLASNGSDFFNVPALGIASAVGYGCGTGFDMDSVLLTFNLPFPTNGTFVLGVINGTDGNTLLDYCDSPIPAGSNTQFTITPPAPLTMGTVTPPPCAPTSLTLTFGEPIKCNSVAANGSDFTISGPSAVTISSASVVNCNANGEANAVTIQLSAPILAAGVYLVNVATGSDGNTLIGQCSRQVTMGSSASFTVTAQAPIAMGTVTPPPCTPQSITLTFAEPVNCNSIAANGSDFVITGPSATTVTSAAATCNANGETSSIIIQLSAPILVTGTYNVQMATGSDGNTLTGNCGRQTTAGEPAPFTLAPQPAIAMGTVDPPLCTPQSIALTFADPVRCNSIAANGSDFVITGPSAVTITSASATCNANGETTSITVQFSTRILIPGTYTVQMSTGSDGNTLIGQCNRQVNAGTTASFILAVQPPLPLGTVTPPSCSPSSVTINFAESFDCTSVSANGSEFIITGPSVVTITAAGAQCNINPNLRTITIQLSAPIIVSGTYQLEVQTGTDGNTIRGDCNRYITVGDFTTFTIPPASPVAMDSLVPVACSPSALKLIFSSPIKCSSIAANGSDFTVTGPTPVAISSATGVCDANGLTTGIDIQLASPVVTGGLYILQLVGGTDGNTLVSDCNRQTPAGVSLSFTPSDTVSAEFQYQIQYDCTTDVITFSHNGQHNVNLWAWTVNGTAASNLQTFTQNFSAASRNDVQLVVSNGVCSDTYSTTIVLNNKVTVDFISPESVCPEDTVSFIEKTTGQVDNWQWTLGNGNTSTLQAPPSQIYPLTGTEILYPVTLQVSNTLGCSASATKTLKVLSGCIIAVPTAFTPNSDGKNDYLYPLNALKADNLDFKIYNRWGQLVFHSKDWRQKWDGRINGVLQGTNVYIWTLNFTHRDTKQKYSLKGTSTLIR